MTATTANSIVPVNDNTAHLTPVLFVRDHIPNTREMAILFRRTVSHLDPLRHSLLGFKPKCADLIDLNIQYHQRIRQFRDESGLREFWQYLQKMAENTPNPHPLIINGYKGIGFCYKTVSRRGRIGILSPTISADYWTVWGRILCRNPETSQQILEKDGFTVRLGCAPKE